MLGILQSFQRVVRDRLTKERNDDFDIASASLNGHCCAASTCTFLRFISLMQSLTAG